MSKTFCLLSGMLALVMMQPALAAKRLGPPIEDLQSTPERIRIVVAEALKKPEPGKITFAVTERLTGEAPDDVVLRTDPATFDGVTVGASYVVAWSYQRRNRRVIGGWEEDPEGPFVVSVLGLGSTALFEGTPEMRLLFTPGVITDPARAGEAIDALLAQMQRDDYRSRGLVITELWLRKDLTEKMTAEQAGIMKTVLQTKALDPQHQELLLQSVYRLPPDMTTPWLAEELRKIIILRGTQYDLGSFVPSLVLTAAEGLQQAGNPGDVDLLSTLLYSNNPGVSKAALAAMDHLDREAAVARAQQAMERGWIHGETRNVLNRYLSTGSIR
jgi:hypothetical protein